MCATVFEVDVAMVGDPFVEDDIWAWPEGREEVEQHKD
jgi:hypothetical protein